MVTPEQVQSYIEKDCGAARYASWATESISRRSS